MLKNLQSTTALHNGVEMPWFGLGVFQVKEGEEVYHSVKWALEHGYRSIDTAAAYQNEEGVGKAIKDSGIPREEIFVTSKLRNNKHAYEEALKAFDDTLARLDLEYLDLYLIHWPRPKQNKYKEAWKALEKLYKEKKIRAIGVSNFKEHHLENLLTEAEVVPMVNQVEYHPHLQQKSLHTFCQQHKIQLEAYSPLKQGQILTDSTLTDIAEKYGKSTAQVILRWNLQQGVVTIPKSVKKHRIQNNANIFDFELTEEDMRRIGDLNKDERILPDPDENG